MRDVFDLFIFVNASSKSFEKYIKEKKLKYDFNIYFVNLNLNSSEDVYDKSFHPFNPTEITPYSLTSGPNILFFESLNYLIDYPIKYKSFLLLETDVELIDGWISTFLTFVNNNNFVIAGSKYKGDNAYHKNLSYREHLNGVAIYKNSKQLKKILDKSEKFLLRKVSHGLSYLSFDVAIYESCKNDKDYYNNFINTDFIVNISDPIDSKKTLDEVISLYPNTKILHKKS